ncbi:transposase, partial [Haemophilus influenzae]|uniref:transposase n=1 Tax=Haemophilus influenzae TaxID=727 RepID=UPI001E45395C
MEKKLKREQRKLSRRALLAKNKGTNLFEAKIYQQHHLIVARLRANVINQRTDFLDKLPTEMIKTHGIFC